MGCTSSSRDGTSTVTQEYINESRKNSGAINNVEEEVASVKERRAHANVLQNVVLEEFRRGSSRRQCNVRFFYLKKSPVNSDMLLNL